MSVFLTCVALLTCSLSLTADAKVSVQAPSLKFKQEIKLKAGKGTAINIPTKIEMYGSKKSPYTVIVEASADVAVTSFSSKTYTTDTSLIYPTTEWGTEYIIFTPEGSPRGTFKEFSVTNGEKSNKIEILPNGLITFQNQIYSNGKKIVLDLKPYESVQFQSEYRLSGTKVSSKHPVAVFTGHTCTWTFSKCNHVYEQLLPVSNWGTSFIIPPLSFQNKYDSVYVQASKTAQITVNNGKQTDHLTVNMGQTLEIQYSKDETLYIQADQGIQVLLLFNGLTRRRTNFYDPFLMTILPTDRFCSSYSFDALGGFENKALIVAETRALGALKMDGANMPRSVQWKKVKGSDYSWTEISYKKCSKDNKHTVVSANSRFALYTFGVSQMNAYGTAGQCVQPGKNHTFQLVKRPQHLKHPSQILFQGADLCPAPGTCWAMGDPHYRTFDGQRYDFMGTCTYVLAKKCSKDDDMPAFEVLAQNENRGNKRVSYVGLVVVEVYGITIIIARSEKGQVRINNDVWTLPATLHNNKLRMFQSGRSAIIETNFGLRVSYDWDYNLVITLCGRYAGKTCGLCGNFNNNPNDDFTTPSGTKVDGVLAFGSSWKVPGVVQQDKCRDDCVAGCNSCDKKKMQKWESDKFCGIIILKNGPFSKCHDVINPEAYAENCKFDLCMGGGQRPLLCKTLEAYIDACQAAGVQIQEWRKLTKCSMKCPPNSHYELCGNACPGTCANPDAQSKCTHPCVESCTCNSGFLLSGKKCVPARKCGCTYEGRYIPPGKKFWADDNCQKQCKCKGTQVKCQNKGCGAGRKCQVVDGIRKCQATSSSTCQATGDPHYKTFDKKKFDFQGTCIYQLAALCSKDPELEPFEVLVQNNHRGSKAVSFTKLVEIKQGTKNNVYVLPQVNNQLTHLPFTKDEGEVSVRKIGWNAVVTTDFGLKVTFNWEHSVFVTLPSNYMGAVCGLCGNYDGSPKNDLIPKSGNKPVSPTMFGDSWKVAEVPGCGESCKGKCPDCDITEKNKYENENFCGKIRDPKGPFRDCHAKVNPIDFFEDCVYDVCLYKGRQDVLCAAITSYTTACQSAGAKVYSWRTSQFCAIKCPIHSHYEVCGSACLTTCQSLTSPQGCQDACEEGCVCDEDYVLSGKTCVPFSQCGCSYENRYYSLGEVFYPSGLCEEECKCTEDGEISCKEMKCGPNEECKISNGIQKCHPVGKGVCEAAGDPHYRSFDGKKFDFQGTCTYTLSKSCGLEGTHLEAFSIQVQNAQWEKMRGRAVVAVTKLVAVEVYGTTFTLRNGMNGVLVNGVFNALPVNLNDGDVQVYQDGRQSVIMTRFGLLVTYDLVYHVTVTVPGNYRGKVCGLCGNFNDDQKDDFQMSNHKLTQNVDIFGKSWQVTIPNVVCENGCEGKNCPVCDPSRKAVYSKEDYCGILTAPKGPFAKCHSKLNPQSYFDDCVFDLCEADGDDNILCDSVAAYAFNCHMAGVDINTWRTPSFCPMKCPANSHYEMCADPCSDSCPDLIDIVECPASCTEGCECNDGFIFNGQECIKEKDCGCYDNGKSYKPGEVVYEDDCNTKCTCNPEKGLKCEKHSCPQNTKFPFLFFVTDPCKDANCRVKEKCQIQKGEAVCIPMYTGRCWAWGDPHYHTFDGYNYDFQGTCKYIVSKTCGNLNGLIPFSVTERNENRGNTAVSYVRELDVSVYGYTITIQKNKAGRVMVNGYWLNLPLTLGDGEVSVLQKGCTAWVETNFGLKVAYDWNWQLDIFLPSSYHGLVCGLCGNFNENRGDELQNPAGKAVPSVAEWGKSWRSSDQNDDHCKDSCGEKCDVCDPKDFELYKGEAFCGALTATRNNLFKSCHRKLDPQNFMNNCVYDMCFSKGDKKILCQALASYSKECREEGIVIRNWRKKYGCPMNCQRHSHYEDCASPCQPSCPFPEKKPACLGACVEACVCDKGYVLSAGVCVPTKTCGCSYQGRYYEPGQHFWADETCGRLCECETTQGMVICHKASCSANEKCTMVDGVRACQPISYATCTASGDPHYHTFDGHRFDFQGTCVYQLVKLCSQQAGLEPFEVTVQNDNRGSKRVSYTKTVTVTAYGVILIISRNHPNKVLFGGQLVSLPLDYKSKLVVYFSGQTAVVETVSGITVTFDWRSTVRVTLPSTYQGAVCGLCGNYNGNAKDDLIMPNGQAAPDGTKLGVSWQVGLTPGCSSVCQGKGCQTCTDSQKEAYKNNLYCGIIADKAGPFRECHKRVDPAPYMEDCVYDACQYHGHHISVCDAIEVYVSACQGEGINIYSWRKEDFCPLICPDNSHYTLCATGCPATCASEASRITCHRRCAEACECDEGFLLSGGVCVPIKDCGCTYDGKYYRTGEKFYPEDECMDQCVCGENGAVSCQKVKCHAGEVCKLVDGVKGCHPEGQGKCVASGDPHYISFDGHKFDFQGTCVYVLAKVCNDDKGRLTQFSIIQGNEKYGNGKVAVTKSITVSVFGFTIRIEQKMPWKVAVSCTYSSTAPFCEGRNIVVRTDFGLTVLYDTVYYVEVIVPSSYQGRMCGLCGNYNKNNRDDFQLPNRKQTNNVDSFGKSWVVNLPENMCGGCGDQCPACEQAKVALYRKPNSCGIMNAPNGPFKACHSKIDPETYVSDCVFDVCAVGGDKDTLCNSVQAYALACQSEGIKIQPWRSSSFCPLSCPPNSHYEMCADTCTGTCASFISPGACSGSCFEGCECDEDFSFDGIKCVPLEKCGCMHNNMYLMVGQTVVDKECKFTCVCQTSGNVKCQKLSCKGDEVCEVREGVRGCHGEQGHCTIHKDGLLTSFDDMSGAIGSRGAFEVASLCDEASEQWFRVVVDARVCYKNGPLAVSTLYVFFKEATVAVNSQHVVWVNGRKVSLSSKVTNEITVHVSKKTVIIQRGSSVRVTYCISQQVNVIVDRELSGKVCGACGNYNNNSEDDMRTADGKTASNVAVVVGSWAAGDFSRW
uniref:IgGFc-binding protein-like n=1 Tax=Gouania willdenowi TaxID=441366 RepID=A0A8C5DKG4_GOUWI